MQSGNFRAATVIRMSFLSWFLLQLWFGSLPQGGRGGESRGLRMISSVLIIRIDPFIYHLLSCAMQRSRPRLLGKQGIIPHMAWRHWGGILGLRTLRATEEGFLTSYFKIILLKLVRFKWINQFAVFTYTRVVDILPYRFHSECMCRKWPWTQWCV